MTIESQRVTQAVLEKGHKTAVVPVDDDDDHYNLYSIISRTERQYQQMSSK